MMYWTIKGKGPVRRAEASDAIEEAAKVEPATLRVYTDGTWWVVAFSQEDAVLVLEEEWDFVRRRPAPPFVEETSTSLTVTDGSDGSVRTMSPAEWVQVSGRGVIAATDWGTW